MPEIFVVVPETSGLDPPVPGFDLAKGQKAMNETLKTISYMLRNDPLVVVGFIFIGISGILLAHIQLKMLKLGYKFPYLKYLTKRNWEVPGQYLKIRSQHGLSPLPAYLIWPTAAVGVICLLIGLFRL